jgi:glucose dehydrogenase
MPAFRGDPAHSGTYASDTAPSLDRVAWKFKTGAKVVSSPAVNGGVVYVGGADRVVYALSAADGAVRWQYKTGGAVNSSPAVAADTVFVASADGNLYALGASDGKLRWKLARLGAFVAGRGRRCRLFWKHRWKRLRDPIARAARNAALARTDNIQSAHA